MGPPPLIVTGERDRQVQQDKNALLTAIFGSRDQGMETWVTVPMMLSPGV